MYNKIIALITLAFFLFSCGSEETFEDKLIGTWTGNLTQLDCCTFDIEVNINSLEVNQTTASGIYFNPDYDICNDEIFFCDEISANPSSCSFSWRLDELSTNSIEVFERADGDCANGSVTLSLIDDNTLQYRWVAENEDTNIAIGRITKS